MFKFHIRGKNSNYFFPVFTGGRPFFSTISAVKTVNIEKFSFCTVFTGGALLFLLPYPR